MKLLKFLPFLLFLSCIDLITQKTEYNSLYFKGGSWIEIARIENMKLESNDFTLQFWVSGADVDTNDAPALFSLINELCEPLYQPVRSILPPMSGIDFSPIILLLLIQLAEMLLVRPIFGLINFI